MVLSPRAFLLSEKPCKLSSSSLTRKMSKRNSRAPNPSGSAVSSPPAMSAALQWLWLFQADHSRVQGGEPPALLPAALCQQLWSPELCITRGHFRCD